MHGPHIQGGYCEGAVTQLTLEQHIVKSMCCLNHQLRQRAKEVLKQNGISHPEEVIGTSFDWDKGLWAIAWQWDVVSYITIEGGTADECINGLNVAVYNFITYGTVNNPHVSGPQGS